MLSIRHNLSNLLKYSDGISWSWHVTTLDWAVKQVGVKWLVLKDAMSLTVLDIYIHTLYTSHCCLPVMLWSKNHSFGVLWWAAILIISNMTILVCTYLPEVWLIHMKHFWQSDSKWFRGTIVIRSEGYINLYWLTDDGFWVTCTFENVHMHSMTGMCICFGFTHPILLTLNGLHSLVLYSDDVLFAVVL